MFETWAGKEPKNDSAKNENERDDVDGVLGRSKTRPFFLGGV